ncbi:MAG TPA: hypothetical protein PKA17_09280 [Phenylobacterium sp.]|nr:hypothetical protein [Phenylobacterium sp.]
MRTLIASLVLSVGLGGAALAQEAAEPVAPPAAAPAPVERPTLPTTGDGAAVLSVLTRACVPLVQQTKTFDQATKELNLRRNRRSGNFEAPLGGDRAYTIALLPQGSNTNVCMVEINYPVGGEAPLVEALNIWAFLHEPELVLQRNDFQVGADNIKRITLAWEHFTDSESTGLVFVQLKNPDDTPLERGYDKATLLYSERTF